ncbi:uncharacterized protein I303_105873 [Kwoniella dejecticola CBS 10117]|uniref:Uncharacterized protein n=1 Tax=Kwoniella dejecticola CBS 10117 TaxID=1296121 RepID=A0A1A6A0M2_9TREE|nr:uncharacterized protein I303_05894 [Kwoniella dejecticola CBS 10117]OBR83614.1 hypothetical protein I303_05894 [Kwoniella dejecticola CBS 10117]
MSHTIIPTQPITLPYSHFYTTSEIPYAPALRIKVRPHLLVPTRLISPLATGRRIEECVETIVPVGGKIQVNLKIKSDNLDIGLGCGIENVIKDKLHSLFSLNSKTLGLQPLEPLTDISSRSDPPSSSAMSFCLNPITSSPIHNVLSTHLIPSGHSIAFLTTIDISFEWVFKDLVRRIPVQEEAHKTENEDDVLLMELEDCGQVDEVDPEDENQLSASQHVSDKRGSWISGQIRQGLDRLIRVHFIRRFPLIFDGGLLQYSTSCGLPGKISKSLAKMFNLSNDFGTPLAVQMKECITSMTCIQESELHRIAETAVNLPTRKRKRYSSQNQNQNPNQDQHITTGGCSPKKHRIGRNVNASHDGEVIEPSDSDRMQLYIRQVKDRRKEWENEGNCKVEKRLCRVISDVTGQMGRSKFIRRRVRAGRMSYNRIEILHDGLDRPETGNKTEVADKMPHAPAQDIILPNNDDEEDDSGYVGEQPLIEDDEDDEYDEDKEYSMEEHSFDIEQDLSIDHEPPWKAYPPAEQDGRDEDADGKEDISADEEDTSADELLMEYDGDEVECQVDEILAFDEEEYELLMEDQSPIDSKYGEESGVHSCKPKHVRPDLSEYNGSEHLKIDALDMSIRPPHPIEKPVASYGLTSILDLAREKQNEPLLPDDYHHDPDIQDKVDDRNGAKKNAEWDEYFPNGEQVYEDEDEEEEEYPLLFEDVIKDRGEIDSRARSLEVL